MDLNNNKSQLDHNNNSEIDHNNNSEVVHKKNLDCNNNSEAGLTRLERDDNNNRVKAQITVEIDQIIPVEPNTDKKEGMMVILLLSRALLKVCLLIGHLLSRAGCGIRLYQLNSVPDHCLLICFVNLCLLKLDIYILCAFIGKPHNKPLERNVVCTSMITLCPAM